MKIALCSSVVPFVNGGYRSIVEWLESALQEAGHRVERVYLPHTDAPDLLFRQMAAFRWVDLSSADRIICFRPPAHLIPHPHKIVWFIHHIRIMYDLWDSPFRGVPDDARYRGIREGLMAADTAALREAKRLFTNSRVMAERLKYYNNLSSEVLYPPVYQPERFQCRGYNEEIVYVSRVEPHKRQQLLIDAMSHTRTGVKLRLCGANAESGYGEQLRAQIRRAGLEGRVVFENQWIDEAHKIQILSECLAAAYLPMDEDSYGFPTLEASHASKPVLTTSDAGGVLEFVQDGVNGLVVEPDPEALADAMDRLYLERDATRRLGESARARVAELQISWPHVLERLLT